MLKSFLLFTAVVLLVTAAASAPARPPQEPGPGAKPRGKCIPEAHGQGEEGSMTWTVHCATVRLGTARLIWRRTCN